MSTTPLTRGANISVLLHVVLGVVMAFAAYDSDGRDRLMFALVAVGAALGVGAALTLRRAAGRPDQVSRAVVWTAASGVAGAVGAVEAGHPAMLIVPAGMVFVNGMLVSLARRLSS